MDAKTIFTMIALACFINCMLIIPYNRKHCPDPTQYHLYAQVCFFISFFLYINVQLSLWIAVANCSGLFGVAFETVAIMKLTDKYSERISKTIMMIVSIIATLQAVILIAVDLSSVRISLVTAVPGMLWLYSTYLLFTNKHRTVLQSLVGILFAIIAGASGFRVFGALMFGEKYSLYSLGDAQTFTFMCMYALMIVSSSGIVLLAKEKTDTQLLIAATHDDLTGVYNRRCFIQKTENAIDFANRKMHPFSLLMLDIDDFKKINDTHGHQIGDLVLKEFSYAMKRELRKHDLIGRIGGEEFVIFLQAINENDAYLMAERLRNFVASNMVGGISFTISMGIFSVDPNDGSPKSFDDIYRQSDLALYEAKNSGRNRVVQRINKKG